MNKTLKPLKAHFSKDKKFIIMNFKQEKEFYSVVMPIDALRVGINNDHTSVGLFFDIAQYAKK